MTSAAVHGDLKVGDRVVYPNQGICRVKGRERRSIAGRELDFVTLSREEDGATILIPTDKLAGVALRRVASDAEVSEVFAFLRQPMREVELDWKARARENTERMASGVLRDVAEVLKGLHALAMTRPLPQKERELYDQARHLVVNEVAAALGLPVVAAEHQIDLALSPPPPAQGAPKAARKPAPAPAPVPIEDAGGPEDIEADDDMAAVFDAPAPEDEEPESLVAELEEMEEEPVALRHPPVARKPTPAKAPAAEPRSAPKAGQAKPSAPAPKKPARRPAAKPAKKPSKTAAKKPAARKAPAKKPGKKG